MPPSWSVLELLRWTAGYLTEKGIPEPRLTADLLLAGVLGVKRLDLYLQFDRPLRPEELAEYRVRLKRRLRREPIQYIEGEAEFRELRLRVDRRVLIPRPETEQLVGEVLQWARGRNALEALDVGTGSGAIALSLLCEGPFARVVATDVSAAALEVAAANRDRLLPEAALELREGRSYTPVEGCRFDVIVSNPPYIAAGEASEIAPEVRDWEPRAALFAGPTGLEVLEPLIAEAPLHLKAGGLLALEIGAAQAEAVLTRVAATPGLVGGRIVRDLAGRDRILLAEAPAATSLFTERGKAD